MQNKIDPSFRFNIDLYLRNRTKPWLQSEIRRVLERRNTPPRLVAFPLVFVMYTRRRRIPSVAKRIQDIQTMKDPRLPVFALTLNTMEDLDQRCDRRVESDPLTLNPMATANQTAGGVGSVGNGRLRMGRPARLTLHRVYKLCPY